MKKRRMEIILILFLIAIFVLLISRAVLMFNRAHRAKPKAPVGLLGREVGNQPDTFNKIQQDEKLEWSRDPFSGKIYVDKNGTSEIDLSLSGILWDEKTPRALIGNEIVKQGSMIGKYMVVRIDKNRVILNDGTKDMELTIK